MMTIPKLAGTMLLTAVGLLVLLAPPGAAQEDLDCDSPGVGDNFPVDPNNDPNGFDADHDGIGCEAGEGGGTSAPAPSTAPSSSMAPSPQPVAALPRTGAGTIDGLVIGSSLVVTGAAALWVSRRLRPRPHQP